VIRVGVSVRCREFIIMINSKCHIVNSKVELMLQKLFVEST
jgi:hypothetical protein